MNAKKPLDKPVMNLMAYNLIDSNLQKKYFHFIFKKLLTSPGSNFFGNRLILNENEARTLLSNFLIGVYSDKINDLVAESKPFLSMIQNCFIDSMIVPKNLSETAIFRILFDINHEIFAQGTIPDFLYLLEL